MSFALSDAALARQAAVRRFVDTELIPWEIEAELNEGEIPADALKRHKAMAQELGLPRFDVPVEHGGLALSTLDQVAAIEPVGRVTNGLGWCYPEAQSWMFEACSPAQIEGFIKPMMRGQCYFAYAITEEGAGSDVDDIVATARRVGDEYVIDGEKWHVTSANLADVLLVQAKFTGGPADGAHGLFFVDARAPGIETVRTPAYTHTYRHHHPILRFTGVRVPADNLIGGREGAGMAFTYAWFRRERLMIAARCCGAMERLIEEATAFAKARIIGGVPIAERQLVQAMLADCVVDLHTSRMVTWEAAAAHDRGLDLKSLHARCSIAKLVASEAAGRVADRAVQIFAGRGYMRENVAERFLRELRVDRIWEGTSEIQRLIIAGGLVKRGLAGTIGAGG